MRKIGIILAIFCFANVSAQNLIGESWKINVLIGIEEEGEEQYILSEMPTGRSSGYLVSFGKDKTFRSCYYAPCGNDCFTCTSGRYIKLNDDYIHLFVYQIEQWGECKMDEKVYRDLGKYYIYRPSPKLIYLIKSSGNLAEDRQIAEDTRLLVYFYFQEITDGKIKLRSSYARDISLSWRQCAQKYAKDVLRLADSEVRIIQTQASNNNMHVCLVKDKRTKKYYHVIGYVACWDKSGEAKKYLFHLTETEIQKLTHEYNQRKK